MKVFLRVWAFLCIMSGVTQASIDNKFYEPEADSAPVGWDKLNKNYSLSLVSADVRYKRSEAPVLETTSKKWQAVAWRGETISAQALFLTKKQIDNLTLNVSSLRYGKRKLPSSALQAHFVRYTKGKGGVLPDVLESSRTIPVKANSARPIWLSAKIPVKTKPGTYRGKIEVKGNGLKKLFLEVEIKVLGHTLAEPKKWGFHLDIWQNPYSIARVHKVELWGKEHLQLIHKYYSMLAEAGQKCITVSLVDKPWGGQTEDPFGEMIKWTKRKNGSWSYDFSVLDTYVKAAMKAGITKQINCYSMIPWSNRFQYFDESSGRYEALKAQPGTPQYENHWRPFLKAFRAHLKKRGWLNKTCVAMDERPHNVMVKVLNFLAKEAPELKIASAINYAKREGSSDLYDISVAIEHAHSIEPKYLADRNKAGMKTTIYVCCNPDRPNTFTHSPPAEAAWLGIHSAAIGYSGFLRWAFNSWVKDPLMDTSFIRWSPGDCFLVYPGFRSSVRFERLKEGIQFYEKYQVIKEAVAKDGSSEASKLFKKLQATMNECTYKKVRDIGAATQVNAVQELMSALSLKCRPLK